MLSLIGYGFFASNILKIKIINLGFLGLIGISFLIFISYLTTLFFAHGYTFNSIILILGIACFFFNCKKINKNEYYKLVIIFAIFLIFILVSKNHDDFPAYHYPYSHLLTQFSHPLGVGHLNPGFRHASSTFFLSSLFYYPFIKHYLFNIYPVYFIGFANLILYNYIINKNIFNRFKSINIFSLLSLSFINIFFYRMAEHGTDRSGMVIIFLIIIIILLINNFFLSKKDINIITNYFKILSILIVLTISLKPFYLLYAPLIAIVFIPQKNRLLFTNLMFTRTTLFSLSLFSLIFFFNWINSGCLIFPAEFTCFNNLPWSFSEKVIIDTNIWFELWSKAGASPNYIVENRVQYIENFNWLSNWFKNYFFNKVSDFLLGLLLLIIIFYLAFFYKFKKNKVEKLNYYFIYFYISVLIIEWFFKHPALRYGGYHLFALFLFLPLSKYFDSIKINYSIFLKRSIYILIITILIFSYRNFNRIIDEYKLYKYNPLESTNYVYDEKFYNRIFRYMDETKNDFKYKKILGKNFIITVPK